MLKFTTSLVALVTLLLLNGCALMQQGSSGQQSMIDNAESTLQALLSQNPAARAINDKAIAVLVFPNVLKAGFIYGGATGNGVLFRNGSPDGIYNTSAVSYGLQAGAQDYSYALFFVNQQGLDYLKKSGGLELGAGPSIAIVDEGFAKSFSTATLTKDIYAFAFNQKGLMAGLGITGSKITRISQ